MRHVEDQAMLALFQRSFDRLRDRSSEADLRTVLSRYRIPYLHHARGQGGYGLSLRVTRRFIEAFALSEDGALEVIDHIAAIDWLLLTETHDPFGVRAAEELLRNQQRLAIRLVQAEREPSGMHVRFSMSSGTPFDVQVLLLAGRRRCRFYLFDGAQTGKPPREVIVYGKRFSTFRIPRAELEPRLIADAASDSPAVRLFLRRRGIYQLAAAHALCQTALNLTVERTEQREQFGRKIIDNQYVRFTLADLWSHLVSFSEFVDSLAQLEGQLEARDGTIFGALARATELLQKVYPPCLQFHGAHGLITTGRIERFHRMQALLQVQIERMLSVLERTEAIYDAF